MHTKTFNVFSWHSYLYLLLSLCSVIVQIVSCTEENVFIGEIKSPLGRNISFHDVTEDYPTDGPFPTSTIPTKTSTVHNKWPSLYDMSMGKIITLLLVSFSIPLTFMLLLFWRLRKEKKYLRARAGALVYRETIIVPSYAITNASNDVDDYTNSNVVQMHSALYDTPPDYDDALHSSPSANANERTEHQPGPGVEISKNCKMEEIPPPPYSTVYI